jgi:hypothetical protein
MELGQTFRASSSTKSAFCPSTPTSPATHSQVGLVRFHANGAPSYALQYSQLAADFHGSLAEFGGQRQIRGTGNVRGFMATKYVNVVARKKVSGGFAFGAGIGKGEASYTRTEIFQGVILPIGSNTYNRVVPLFKILGRVDIRPIKALSIGPYYGIRNGMFAAGLAVRMHLTKSQLPSSFTTQPNKTSQSK